MSSDIITLPELNQARLPIEIRIINGVTFYRPKFSKDWYISGTEICRVFGYKHDRKHSNRIWEANKDQLFQYSKLLEIPTKTAKKNNKRCPIKEDTFNDKNFQQVRCYDRIGMMFFVSRLQSEKAKDYTLNLIKAFDHLTRHRDSKSLEWDELRILGKQARRLLTDNLKILIEYATMQGSTKPGLIYIRYTNKIYKLLFDLKCRSVPNNFRDTLTEREITVLKEVEQDISNLIEDAMDLRINYKEIYKMINPIIINGRDQLMYKKKKFSVHELRQLQLD